MKLFNFFKKKPQRPTVYYPNYEIPEIPRELEDFESLLNMYGLYSHKSKIVEDGVYDSDFITIDKKKDGTLHLQLTFTPTNLRFNSDKISINLTIEDGGILVYPNSLIDCIQNGTSFKKIPKKELYYITTFSSLIVHTYKFDYWLYDELHEYFTMKFIEKRDETIDGLIHSEIH
jgi:hypothetical protein